MEKRDGNGNSIAFWTSFVLFVVMGIKATKGKPVPIMMAILGLAGLIYFK
jgi:uncharacterized membrane protein (UPF0136 family)